MKIEAKSKWVMIGDSVTDSGRSRPSGEGLFNALGTGYPAVVDALIHTVYPELSLRIVNKGASGNTVRDLKARWQEDVLDQKPDWLSIMIGINDVWRQFDSPRQTEQHVLPDEYAQTLEELVGESAKHIKQIVLMTPFVIDVNRADRMRLRMDAYGAIVRQTAIRHNAIFVDTQAAFDIVLAHYHSSMLAWDRIHPGQGGTQNIWGHMIIARALLNAIGFVWS